MNNIFSISRFTLLLKKDIAENIRLYAIGAASLLFGLATLMVLFTPMMSLPEEGGQFFATFPIYNIFVFGVCIAASLMFAPMRTKQGRISLFTLPATSTEKYLEQVFVHIICFTVMFVCCVILAEGIRMVVAPLLWGPGATGGAYAVDRYINHFSFSPGGVSAMVFANLEAVGITFNLLMAVFAAGAFCSVGIFSLGAALWPKYSFIKTYVGSLCCADSIRNRSVDSVRHHRSYGFRPIWGYRLTRFLDFSGSGTVGNRSGNVRGIIHYIRQEASDTLIPVFLSSTN